MTETKTKTSAKKATPSEVAPKKAVPKPRAKKVVVEVSPQNRYEMIQHTAYFLAKCNNFEGDPLTYWTAAEAQIDNTKS
jgi:hypothetical protein